jgi:hypothetical protein
MHTTFYSENLKEREYLRDLCVDGQIILKEINRLRGCELDSSDSGWGPMAGFCEHGNESTVSINEEIS